MDLQKYSVNQHLIGTILAWVTAEEIAIPEIQRPFLWKATKVRDLLDSLYQGYPVGYLIAWQNPTVRLKDGTTAIGKKVLIDGQQRVTALAAAILGREVINQYYKKVRIRIAFHPVEERFEVLNPAIAKNKAWFSDISPVVSGDTGIIRLVKNYIQANPGVDEDMVEGNFEKLKQIPKKQIGLIELAHDLDIEKVTEIFIRINSKGVPLSQADFAMSKIAANDDYGGPRLRKLIDYFCHLAVAPEFYPTLVKGDKDFTKTDIFKKIAWLKDEKDDLYDPGYTDLLRVAFTSQFDRGRLADLVSLLSGRNFETKTYEEEIAEEAFATLEKGIVEFVNEANFKKFVMIIRSAGFIDSKLIRSQNVLNFAYVLYLKLRSLKYKPPEIERYVRKWFVLSVLTGRYSGQLETFFDFDIKQVSSRGMGEFLADTEKAELSDAFWDVGLVQALDTSVTSSPYFNVYLAAQAKANDKGFLSRDITVTDLITHKGDIHHIFPRDYLKRHGLKRKDCNQMANYVYMQSEINITVGNKSPKEYLGKIVDQCKNGTLLYGGIRNENDLRENLVMNCIPEVIFDMDVGDYDDFLKERRVLIAQKIRGYYKLL